MPATPVAGNTLIHPHSGTQQVHVVEGWALAEMTGSAPARVRIHDGADANGDLMASITLAANESVRDFLIPQALTTRSGSGALYVEVVSGSVEGAIWWA